MNYILSNDQLNHFMNEAGNGESAQDIALIQPTDIASEDNGGDIPLGDIGNDLNAVMETAELGLTGARLMNRTLTGKKVGETIGDTTTHFYGPVADKIAQQAVKKLNGNELKVLKQDETGVEWFRMAKAAQAAKTIGRAAVGLGGLGEGIGAALTIGIWKESDKAQRAGGVLSGLMGLAGLIAAPFTGGVSLTLDIGAAAVGVGTGLA